MLRGTHNAARETRALPLFFSPKRVTFGTMTSTAFHYLIPLSPLTSFLWLAAWARSFAREMMCATFAAQGDKMKKSTEDQITGAARQASGKIKQETGRITRNRSLQAKGMVEKNVGKVQSAAGRAKARRGR